MGALSRSFPVLLLAAISDLAPRGMALSPFSVSERVFRSTDGSPDVTMKVLGNSRTGEWVTHAHTHTHTHTHTRTERGTHSPIES